MDEQETDKQQELAKVFLEAMRRIDPGSLEDEARNALAAFCEIRVPKVEVAPLDTHYDYVKFGEDGWKGGTVSIKPGNVTLNLRKLLSVVASGVLTVGGAVTAPWTIPFAALVLWDSVYSGMRCDISEREAVVLWVMWQLKDEHNCVAHSKVLSNVNIELRKAGRQELQPQQLDEATRLLVSLRCIEKAKNTSEHWWLREWVSVEYK